MLDTDRPSRRHRHVTWTDDAAAHGEALVRQVEEKRNRAAGILPPEEPAERNSQQQSQRTSGSELSRQRF